jgi:hypothetical protein
MAEDGVELLGVNVQEDQGDAGKRILKLVYAPSYVLHEGR